MKWYTRREDQGQMIEVSYAYDSEGGAYRRTHDRADRTTSYAHGALDWDREPEQVDYDRSPCVVEWVGCAEPSEYADEPSEYAE